VARAQMARDSLEAFHEAFGVFVLRDVVMLHCRNISQYEKGIFIMRERSGKLLIFKEIKYLLYKTQEAVHVFYKT
jgi:hypothetical protein